MRFPVVIGTREEMEGMEVERTGSGRSGKLVGRCVVGPGVCACFLCLLIALSKSFKSCTVIVSFSLTKVCISLSTTSSLSFPNFLTSRVFSSAIALSLRLAIGS